MKLTTSEKTLITQQLANCFAHQPEVKRVVIFGSFLNSDDPHDLDLAVFQDSHEEYLPLALRYRRLTRPVAQQIPLDIVPLRATQPAGSFLKEIDAGQVIYER